MSSFLELCQMTARESGTIAGALPTSVIGQTARLEKIVHWTNDAWRLIQTLEPSWQWMQAEYQGTITPGTARYTGMSFGAPDLSAFHQDQGAWCPHSLYRTAEGPADERPLRQIGWRDWRARYDRGAQQPGRPTEYAISPAGEICLGPNPEMPCVIRGEYQRRAALLIGNGDVPGMPEQFHAIIAWRAVMLLDEHDEAVDAVRIGRARNNYAELLGALRAHQLPVVTMQFPSVA